MQVTLHATRSTPHGGSRLMQTISVCAVKTRRAPFRHCTDARVYGHATTTIHDKITLPPWAERVSHRRHLRRAPPGATGNFLKAIRLQKNFDSYGNKCYSPAAFYRGLSDANIIQWKLVKPKFEGSSLMLLSPKNHHFNILDVFEISYFQVDSIFRILPII